MALTLSRDHRAYAAYAGVALVVLAPLLLPGYILTLDMVFTPVLAMPSEVTSSYPFYAALHYLDRLLPSELIQKLLLLLILVLASVGTHRLVRHTERMTHYNTESGIYLASILFTINPFTYSRFMAGHFVVLLGYALLPWVLCSMIRLWQRPSYLQALRTGCWILLVGTISIHTLGLLAVIATCGLAVGWRQAMRRSPAILATLVIILVGSSYWLWPLISGEGRTAYIVQQFSPDDFAAFATTGTNIISQLLHILSLQGLWSEGRGLYLLPHTVFPLWPLTVLFFWILVGYGYAILWRRARLVALWLAACGLAAIFLALGPPMTWLTEHIPMLAGFREPHKFVGILALAYAINVAYGTSAVLRRAAHAGSNWHTSTSIALLLLPVMLTPVMYIGFAGQLKPRTYPPDWYAINQQLMADSDDFQVVFMPWHQYMSFDFAGRIIANPASNFFGKPTIVSDDPELEGAIATNTTPMVQNIGNIVKKAPKGKTLGTQLGQYEVKYILLAKELDYKKYDYLADQIDIELIRETDNLRLYRNTAWKN